MSMGTLQEARSRERFRILGIPIDVTSMSSVVNAATLWARGPVSRTVFVREVASLMVARDEQKLADLHETADLIVPDGMPLVWIGKLRGFGKAIGRVSGADLVDAVCAQSIITGQTHYFFGGKPGVAELMASNLEQKYVGLKVVGTYSPPFRHIGPDYVPDAGALAEIEKIRLASPDFVWVGISSPKQEYWMSLAARVAGHGVFFGVGAAFDFHTGEVKRAPKWMQSAGLEWSWRLFSEPKRLWRRYLILAPHFVFCVVVEQIQIKLKWVKAV